MLEIAEEQIFDEARKKRKLFAEDNYIIFCLFKKLTAGQCMSILDELIEEGIYPGERCERRFNAKSELASFLIHKKLPSFEEIKDYWQYYR